MRTLLYQGSTSCINAGRTFRQTAQCDGRLYKPPCMSHVMIITAFCNHIDPAHALCAPLLGGALIQGAASVLDRSAEETHLERRNAGLLGQVPHAHLRVVARCD